MQASLLPMLEPGEGGSGRRGDPSVGLVGQRLQPGSIRRVRRPYRLPLLRLLEGVEAEQPPRRKAARAAPGETAAFALLLHAAGGRGLGRKAAAVFAGCERRERILYVPVAVVWEVSLLARVGRINLRRSVRAFFGDLFSNPAYQPVDTTAEQALLADELRFTRDPFDALICAAARTLALPLLTRDAAIHDSGDVKTLW
jgi:PIN domain nuclease of toxin-antitoxin system